MNLALQGTKSQSINIQNYMSANLLGYRLQSVALRVPLWVFLQLRLRREIGRLIRAFVPVIHRFFCFNSNDRRPQKCCNEIHEICAGMCPFRSVGTHILFSCQHTLRNLRMNIHTIAGCSPISKGSTISKKIPGKRGIFRYVIAKRQICEEYNKRALEVVKRAVFFFFGESQFSLFSTNSIS